MVRVTEYRRDTNKLNTFINTLRETHELGSKTCSFLSYYFDGLVVVYTLSFSPYSLPSTTLLLFFLYSPPVSFSLICLHRRGCPQSSSTQFKRERGEWSRGKGITGLSHQRFGVGPEENNDRGFSYVYQNF